jgi:hypothetical protein
MQLDVALFSAKAKVRAATDSVRQGMLCMQASLEPAPTKANIFFLPQD